MQYLAPIKSKLAYRDDFGANQLKTQIIYKVWYSDSNGYSRNAYRKHLASAEKYGNRQFQQMKAYQVVLYRITKTTFSDGTFVKNEEYVKSLGLRSL